MKKLLLILCCAFAASTAFAQVPSIGVRGGVNFAKFSGSDGENGGSTNSVTTFGVGAFVDFKTGGNFSIQPGLSYTGKGSEGTDETTGNLADIKTYYLQVPVNIVYHIPAVFGNVYLGAGPYMAIGLSGNVKGRNGSTLNEDIHFGDGTDGFKRTEFGLNGIAGLEFKGGFILGLNYDMGLTSIIDADPVTLNNRVFGISVGYKF